MTDNATLGQVALGYSPFIDRSRAVTATRLTIYPLRPELKPDVAQLLHAVGGVWPADGGRASLNIVSESLLQDLMGASPSANLMIEIPAFMACDEANVAALQALHRGGNTLLLKGRPMKELPRELLPCFKFSLIDLADDRRVNETGNVAPAGVTRNISHVQSGVRNLADMEASFSRGAAAVLGWPIDDAIHEAQAKGKSAVQIDLQVIVELIQRVDAQDPIEKLENTLKRDPSLAFKLMRYINSPAFGLRVEISSFRHAIMMLGYQRLKRWLALLLATAGKDVNMKPVMFAAVRRGLLMEELVRSSGDEEMRNEMFICGVFSLLDRMFKQPFSDLMKTIPVPERVYQALVDGTGPYQPYFDLVQAVEHESLYDFRTAADTLMLSVSEINRAVLGALTSASQID
ncbi:MULTISPECIES: EAL and HDOD domain-containing protein [unclassified Rhizobacter]|uniref:EAL and HDOD domain-containing protein n=1 Tax=unclassified Rhizobacter TaxID=2640088 RepID=UPI0006FC2363|nr:MULTISPECIES: HDOD domain-containing protein [unclassified Rhizobacter]KQU71318.1 histidine kinase [Rhizobacter sp. Root29]KQW10636.1 histidine kinase [Rhizobacter sp. Root1238]KRB24712.1 histidine kinase [Rhizobacter sp. Root16D2]